MSSPAWDSKVTAGSRHVTPLQGRPAPRAHSHNPLTLEKWPGSPGQVEGTFIFEDLQHWFKWTQIKPQRCVPTCQALTWRSHGGACEEPTPGCHTQR